VILTLKLEEDKQTSQAPVNMVSEIEWDTLINFCETPVEDHEHVLQEEAHQKLDMNLPKHDNEIDYILTNTNLYKSLRPQKFKYRKWPPSTKDPKINSLWTEKGLPH